MEQRKRMSTFATYIEPAVRRRELTSSAIKITDLLGDASHTGMSRKSLGPVVRRGSNPRSSGLVDSERARLEWTSILATTADGAG